MKQIFIKRLLESGRAEESMHEHSLSRIPDYLAICRKPLYFSSVIFIWRLTRYSLIDHYTDEDIGRLHHLNPGEISADPRIIFDEVVVPTEELYELAFRTLV